MKIRLLLSALFISLLAQGQMTKMESFFTGTRVSFYPNECGNDISEAQGKLSFCDRANNLGVVESSYGLNDKQVRKMAANYHNQDEVYLTNSGISIRNTDSTWENIPNIAIPLWGNTYLPSVKNALVLPDGRLLIQATNAGYVLNIYDRVSKAFTTISFTGNRYPEQFVYDADRNLTWIFAKSGVTTYLFTYNGTTLNEIASLGNVITIGASSPVVYNNNHIFIGNNLGLYKIDVSDYTNSLPVVHYDSTTTPALAFDKVSDIQSNNNTDLWIVNHAVNNDYAILKFNISTETYDIYQTTKPNNSSQNIKFKKIALNDNGKIWVVSGNYLGLIELNIDNGVPSWNFLSAADLSALGLPITYFPNNAYYKNNKFYFTISSNATSSNANYEVLINDNGSWSGRNDNAPGNLSHSMIRRFNNSLPDAAGGVWWFNSDDNIIVYRDSDGNHQSISLNMNSYNQAIDIDNKAIVKGGSPSEIRKIDFPDAVSIQNTNNRATDMKRYKNQIWIYDKTVPKIDIYQNENLVSSLTLDQTDYQYFYYMAVDDEANTWFMRHTGGNLQIKKFDTNALTTTTYDRPERLGILEKILAAPNNAIWIIGYNGVIYIKDDTFYTFLTADYATLNHIGGAVVDANGKLYILNNDTFSITTLENPTTTPILTKVELQGNNSILPSLELLGGRTITIDSEGSVWTHSNLKSIKLIDDDLANQYIQQGAINTLDQKLSALSIYPNPTNGIIRVKTKLVIDCIEVYSVLGKKISSVSNLKSVDLSSLTSGIYLIKITSKNKSITKKIMLK